jgi:hypothetical protein
MGEVKMLLIIYLRNLNTSPCEMIAETEMRIDSTSDLDDTESFETAFTDFVTLARAAMPLKERVDVYIGFWGDQTTFSIPHEFFQLITETSWPVLFDIND